MMHNCDDSGCDAENRAKHIHGHCRWCGTEVEVDKNDGFSIDKAGHSICPEEHHLHQYVIA